MKKYIIQDVLEAYIKEDTKEDTNEYFFGLATSANINRAISQEQLKAGIGNKTFYVMSVDDGITFSVTSGLHYADVYEIQTGQKFEAKTDLTWNSVVEASDGTLTVTEETAQAGDVLDFKANAFPKISEVQLRTIAYDVETGDVAADVIYVFPRALADGNLNEEFGAGANKTQELNFTALVDTKTDSYGKMMIIPRVTTP